MGHLQVVDEPYPLTSAFRTDWLRLHARAIGANVFSTLLWLEQGLLAFAAPGTAVRPVRFVAGDEQTVAMCLLCETTTRRGWLPQRCLRTVDYNVQRFMPIIAATPDHITAALLALYQARARRFDVLDFFKLDGLDGHLTAITDRLRGAGIATHLSEFNLQPYLLMRDTWEEEYRTHSPVFWKNPRRMHNKLEREVGPVRYVRVRTAADLAQLPATLDAIGMVMRKSWQAADIEQGGNYTVTQMEAFYRAIAHAAAPHGNLDLNVLYANDIPIAFDYNVVEAARVYVLIGMYDGAYAKYSPGKVLMTLWLRDSHARGDRRIEFGGEHLEYKAQWASTTAPAFRLRLRGTTLVSRVATLLGR